MNKLTPSLTIATALSVAVVAVNTHASVDGFALEEVIVTAQKRAEDSQSVPISIQAFSADSLEKLGATELRDLSASAPSFNIGGIEGSQGLMGIRGVVDYGRNVGVDARTGVYIDGVYQGRSFSSNQPLLGLESVEILRGPQGTLFGKNTVSGAINLNTKNPTEEFESEFRISAGNYGAVGGGVYLSGALADNLFASLAIAHQQRDGYYQNTLLNREVGEYSQDTIRAKLRYQASDALEIIVSMDYGQVDNEGPLTTAISSPAFTTSKGFVEQDDIDYGGAAVTVNYELDNGYSISSITAYRDAEYTSSFDGDYSAATLEHSFFDEDADMLSQELRIVSPQTDRFDWVAGLYYYNGTASTGRYSQLFAAPINVAYGLPSEGLIVRLPSTVDTDSYALYTHGNFRFAEGLELTAGLRYTVEEKELSYQQIPSVNFPALGVVTGALNSQDRAEDLSPSIGLNWEIFSDAMIYTRYSKAYKSGGWNADFNLTGGAGFNDAFMKYEQESVDAYELGLKSNWLDNSLRINATLFRSEFKDFHVQDFSTLQYTNAAEAISQGAELELTYIPTNRIKISFNTTYLDTNFEDYNLGGLDLSGAPLPYAPQWKSYLGLQFIQPVGDQGDLTLNLDGSYSSENYSDPRRRADQFLNSHNTWNARLTFNPASDSWQVSAWVKNGSDKEYFTQASNTFLGRARGVLGAPRTYGLNFSYFM